MTDLVARCESCGILAEGSLEEVGDAAEAHDDFHDVSIERVATDGGREFSDGHLRFADHLVPLVLDGDKTATVRLDNELPRVGDELPALTESGTKFADLEVKRVAEGTVAEALSVVEVWGKTHNANDMHALMDVLEDCYGHAVAPGATVQIIAFDASNPSHVVTDGGRTLGGARADRQRGKSDGCMERVTFRVPEGQVDDLEALVDEGRYPNRSEAIRDAIRRLTEVVQR